MNLWKIVLLSAAVSFSPLPMTMAETPSSAPTKPPRYIVGLSPFLEKTAKEEVYQSVIRLLIDDLPLGASLHLYDAYNMRTITRMDIPDVRAFRSSKTRANQFKDQILKLKEFLATDHLKPDAPRLPLQQAVRLPQFLDFIGANLKTRERPLHVIVLGSPLYLDHKEPGFSMIDGYFPSDAHLLVSRDQSVFGLKDRLDALHGLVLYLGYFGDPWVSEVHREKITRFWSLYLQGQGARLARLCGDLPTIFNALRNPSDSIDADRTPYPIDRTQSKLEMLRMTREIGAADWITRDLLAHAQHDPPSSSVGPMKIGIRWQGQIDLDLYACPKPAAQTLYFEHTRTPEGYYFKDHRSSPEREYEFVEFEAPVDLWQVQARVNFYEGHMPGGPTGEIRIEFENKIYTGQFSIASDHGNKGRTGPSQGAFWTIIDIPAILKLRPGPAAVSQVAP